MLSVYRRCLSCRPAARRILAASLLVLAANVPVAAQTGTLAADTAVTSTHPATNYGTLSNLYVSRTSTALLRFDLGTLPAGARASDVNRATLRIFVNRVNTPGVVAVSAVNGAWNESAVTAQTLPPTGNSVEVFPVTDEGQFVTVDVTPLVQAWLTAPAKNFGLALTSSAADLVLDSKENDTTAHSAQLEIALSSGEAGSSGPVGPQGPKGDTGATGAGGLAGAQGQVGSAGAQGLQGLKGDPGASGTGGGMLFEGVFSLSATYAKNSVVTSANAAWVSLQDGNAGHEPATSAEAWGVLVPASTGTGTGTGTPANGLAYAGVFASTATYGTGQVVTWQSAAWVSLHDSNHGNTPNESVGDWSVLVPASTNPATVTTVINGLLYDGTYASTTNYAANHVVTSQGAAWVSLHEGNHGNPPGEAAGDWAVLVPAAVGLTGLTGLTGNAGVSGPQGERGFTGDVGLQGDRGAIGLTGRPGFVNRGVYGSETNYTAGDVVLWQGGSWASLHDANQGNAPSDSPTDWSTLTTRGLTGLTGDTGTQGPIGTQGPAGQFGSPGERGIVGPVGSTGPQGAPGRDGTVGAQGEVGPAGFQGGAGPVGLTWRGAYNSLTNYAMNDAVTWAGQSWLSLHDANHGNPPGASAADWVLLAAQGGTGPSGLQGSQGEQGARGDIGVQGARGDRGESGSTGQEGSPGMLYRGVYVSTIGYALHDAVSFAGSTWISLAGTNHGNTPDATPTWWQQIAAPGAAGPAGLPGLLGAAGPQGLQGSQGLPGLAGLPGASFNFRGEWSAMTAYAAGDAVFYGGSAYITASAVNGNPPGVSAAWALLVQQGATGAGGPAGVQGVSGTTGAVGAAGAQGATGVAGLRWMGAYSSSTGYAAGDAVAYDGGSYVSQVDVNVGVVPGSGPQWTLLAAPGAAGSTGVNGSNGAAGARGSDGAAATIQVGTVSTGAPGSPAAVQNAGSAAAATLNFILPQGAAGAAGLPGLVFQGTWAAGSGYGNNDVVSRGGSAFVSQHGGNTTDPLVAIANSTGDWLLLASKGDAGPATVTIGSVTTGNTATITNSGSQNAAVLDFTLPRGDTGVAGPAGLTFHGAWAGSTAYRVNDAVTYANSTYIAVASSTGVQPAGVAGSTLAWTLLALQGAAGAPGPAGATGPTGAAPTIAVAATHTGAPGTQAVVLNTGTEANVQLDFTIPQGAAGSGGSSSSGTYTTVHSLAAQNAGLQVYSPLVDGHAAGDAFTVLAYLPATCHLGTVLVYNSSSIDARFEIHTGTPGNMAATSAGSCVVRANSATTCTGPGLLGQSNFVTFGMTSSSPSITFVYTQFSCN